MPGNFKWEPSYSRGLVELNNTLYLLTSSLRLSMSRNTQSRKASLMASCFCAAIVVSFLLRTRFSLPSSITVSYTRLSFRFRESSKIWYAFLRLVPYVIFTSEFPKSAFFPFTFHCPVTSEYWIFITSRFNKCSGVSNTSLIKSSINLGSIHVAPIRTSISLASSSLGCTRFKASTLTAYMGSFFAKVSAASSLFRTFPLK